MAATAAAACTVEPTTVNGLAAQRISSPSGSSCTVVEFGGCMTSFVDATGQERLYVSPSAVFDGKKAIRGGVPIIFPQFGPDGPLPNHGFARTSTWRFEGVRGPAAVFSLSDSPDTRAIWDFSFRLELAITLHAAGFDSALTVVNTGAEGFEFQALLHSYHALESAEGATVSGLAGVSFVDKLAAAAVVVQEGDIVIDREVDRIYRASPTGAPAEAVVVAKRSAGGKSIHVDVDAGEAAPELAPAPHEVVIWNPWVDKSASLGDLPDDGYKSFVCVEPGRVDGLHGLRPEASFVLTQRVRYE
ncbi:hypothetical protein FNF29_01178 [Cafeteria roenbergensis]|uniref:glucose-6-phosphate 1-epimerase n=1 Tax=Cafeteria roenbergensis TaxID=33653 RepID=A0A5A8CTD3_CAFRO|nr:hypothetical protein FNF29_01178 [Cafeteria roenbergensis]KAA0168491.1 hypothetical protein FNF31_00373 [Cafeteria roenbergensis]|eukprot:KAA0156385.1 hypothetical protein FNF29_01178 [Cafeteria roenbergensis]